MPQPMQLLRAASRLSRVWTPTGGIAVHTNHRMSDGHEKLVRAGYLRQSQAGIFHMLPLGLRVQSKIEKLVEKHMEGALGASKVSLSSLSTEALWEKSGRLQNVASELFRFTDRKDTPYLLAPTHEEEITSLVAKTVKSYKELPLRLYQITRKYRDEFRPRHGLLRGREFTMKDLYTFDGSLDSALETYEKVRAAYSNIFAEMRLPVLAAKASSGDMGGDLSHEYHLPASIGDDRVIHCDTCDYVINDEIAETTATSQVPANTELGVWRGITKDRTRLINVWYPKRVTQPNGGVREYSGVDISIPAVKSAIPDLDSAVGDAAPLWLSTVGGAPEKAVELVNLLDGRLPKSLGDRLRGGSLEDLWPAEFREARPIVTVTVAGGWDNDSMPLGLLRVHSGDDCPKCSHGTLTVDKAIELGHTFHLGTRYSDPLGALVSLPGAPGAAKGVPMQMGCHGIGISRIIAAVAEHFADEKGLNWPVSIAPYSCVMIAKEAKDEDLEKVHTQLDKLEESDKGVLDVVIDDRHKSMAWKLADADLVGYPIIVVLGREWSDSGRVEVQCRRLRVKEAVSLEDLPKFVNKLHERL
ncbi:hypothetical protein B0T16DRAFT_398289 [Cercophora newfieldiana]|uniref:proline--tRNA ligase n=1 Tax=Cercophora newfieldiana TaxID=92897 RepID=A0AA39YNW0_9PEZI|nr:hypothetical protein B0T16DRAFT_398289 [Cercophora newfieldiana]